MVRQKHGHRALSSRGGPHGSRLFNIIDPARWAIASAPAPRDLELAPRPFGGGNDREALRWLIRRLIPRLGSITAGIIRTSADAASSAVGSGCADRSSSIVVIVLSISALGSASCRRWCSASRFKSAGIGGSGP